MYVHVNTPWDICPIDGGHDDPYHYGQFIYHVFTLFWEKSVQDSVKIAISFIKTYFAAPKP